MRYIKRCKNCLREVRFPLDKGILLVTCPYCHTTFRIDPDDISTYAEGRFDLIPLQTNLKTESFFSSTQANLKKIIVAVLFTLLFLNLFKSFGGFSNPSTQKENQEEQTPSPIENEEDLEFI